MTSLYVGNLPYSTTEADLRTLFARHGRVVNVRVAVDRETQRPRGFAFVEMGTPIEASAAVAALDSYEMHDRRLVVNIARPREASPYSYTDGLVEFNRNADERERRLLAATRAAVETMTPTTARFTVETVLVNERQPFDDIAVVTIQFK